MKKLQSLFFLFSIVGLLLVSACGSDDDDEDSAEPTSDLVGTWVYSSVQYDFLVNGVDFIQFLIAELGLPQESAEEFEGIFEESIETEADGIGFEGVTFTFNGDGTYSVQDPEDGTETGTYSVNSNETQITFTSDGDTFTADVLELTSSRLTMSITEEDASEDIDGDGSPDAVTVAIELSLTKQ